MRLYVKENVSKTFRGLKDNLTIMAKGSGNSIPNKIVRWGRWKAISIAPHYSGATKRAIQIINTKTGESKIRLNRPQQPGRTGKPDYHLWMHDVGEYEISAHVRRSGDPHFMFTTAKAMEKQVDKMIRKQMNKVK